MKVETISFNRAKFLHSSIEYGITLEEDETFDDIKQSLRNVTSNYLTLYGYNVQDLIVDVRTFAECTEVKPYSVFCICELYNIK